MSNAMLLLQNKRMEASLIVREHAEVFCSVSCDLINLIEKSGKGFKKHVMRKGSDRCRVVAVLLSSFLPGRC